MESRIQQITLDLAEKLAQVDERSGPLERVNTTKKIIDSAAIEITQILKTQPFANDFEGIEFFKIINPKILALQIIEDTRYNLEINKPINTNEALVNYYEEELKVLQSFIRMNNFHYQYYKNGFKELDNVYFLKNSGPISIPIPEVPGSLNEYFPPMSYLFGKFMAYENMQYFILDQISLAKSWPGGIQNSRSMESVENLRWTGDIVNIVELAYGLWLTGQFNNGNASLAQIVRWLEKNLEISVGNIQKRFTEIERRKRVSTTKFIDQLKEAILKKIESDLD